MTINKELEKLYESKLRMINSGVFGIDEYDIKEIVKKAYILGRTHRKIEEYSKDNPYHIDYERQTKLDFNEME